jgi:hypothetical protein
VQLATDMAETGCPRDGYTILRFGLADAERTRVPGVPDQWRAACRRFAARYGLPQPPEQEELEDGGPD